MPRELSQVNNDFVHNMALIVLAMLVARWRGWRYGWSRDAAAPHSCSWYASSARAAFSTLATVDILHIAPPFESSPAAFVRAEPTAHPGASQHRDDQAVVLHRPHLPHARALSGCLPSTTLSTPVRCPVLPPSRKPLPCTPTATLGPIKLWRHRAACGAVHALRPTDAS